jgi:hypothetical protein
MILLAEPSLEGAVTLRCWGSLADGSRWIAVEPPPAESLNPPEFFGITLFLHLLFIRSASVQAVLFLFFISLSNFLVRTISSLHSLQLPNLSHHHYYLSPLIHSPPFLFLLDKRVSLTSTLEVAA